MIDTTGKELMKGDKVILTNPSEFYSISAENPAFGTKHFVSGIYQGGQQVEWDNGCVNGYIDNELTVCRGQSPMKPTEGKYIPIWKK